MSGNAWQPHSRLLVMLLLTAPMLLSATPWVLAQEETATQPQAAQAEDAPARQAEAPAAKTSPAEEEPSAEQPANPAQETESPPAVADKPAEQSARQQPPAPAQKALQPATVSSALEMCINTQENLNKRLARLQVQLKNRLQEQEQALANCQQRITDLRHQGERKAGVWKRVVEQAVQKWINTNASARALGLRKCERFEKPRLVVEDDAPVLLLSGRVAEPDKIEKRFRRLQKMLPGLHIDAETLRGLVDECSVEVAGVTLEEGSTIPMRDFESLNPDDLAGLPDAEACGSGALGRELEEKVRDGSVRIKGRWPVDIWVNTGDDFGLCTKDEAGWYVLNSGLEGFVGLYLKGKQGP